MLEELSEKKDELLVLRSRSISCRSISLVRGSIVYSTSPSPVQSVIKTFCANTAVSILPTGVSSVIWFVPFLRVFGNICPRVTAVVRPVTFSILVVGVNWTKRISNVDNERRNERSFKYDVYLIALWRSLDWVRIGATSLVSDDETALGTERLMTNQLEITNLPSDDTRFLFPCSSNERRRKPTPSTPSLPLGIEIGRTSSARNLQVSLLSLHSR